MDVTSRRGGHLPAAGGHTVPNNKNVASRGNISTKPSKHQLHQHRTNPPQNRKPDHASSTSSPAANTQPANVPKKKNGHGRVRVDEPVSASSDDLHVGSPEFDASYESDGSHGLSMSPGNAAEEAGYSAELHVAHEPLKSSAKKTVKSLNHLLAFSFPARERPSASTYKRPQGLVHATFKRERFVQANFRFIVSKSGEYSDNITDPDAVIDWELVEFVVCPFNGKSDELTCSICLESPTCPRMAKCGHIFCWSCILQLFSYHEGSSLAPCPVCLREKMRLVDLRSVIIEQQHRYAPGELLDLVLLQRPKHINLLYPVSQANTTLDPKRPLPEHELDNSARFNRMLVCSRLLELFNTEAARLDAAIVSAKSSQDNTLYMEIAQRMLREEIAAVEIKLSSSSASLSSSLTSSGLLSPIVKPTPKFKLSDVMPERLIPEDCYFFYQCHDGQHLFLHPLSTQYLSYVYGDASRLPAELLQMKILDLETKTLDSSARRKFPTLSHLPTACQFYFALIDVEPLLKDPLLQASFRDEVTQRREAIKKAEALETQKAEAAAAVLASSRPSPYSFNRSLVSHLPDLVPPEFDEYEDSYPELARSANSSVTPPVPDSVPQSSNPPPSHSSSSTPSTAQGSRNNTVWNSRNVMASINPAAEEAFPSLPSHPRPALEPGHIVLGHDDFDDQPPLSAHAATTSANPAFSYSNIARNASAPSSAPTIVKKKKGKKTILIL